MATEMDSRLERFRLDPTDGRAFVALVRSLRQTGSADLLAEVFELRAERTHDDEEGARLWLALADVHWRSDPRGRTRALRNSVERAKSSSTLISALEQILEGRGESDALASVLVYLSEHAPQDRARLSAAERLVRIARTDDERGLAWSRLGRLDPERSGEAAEALLELARTSGEIAWIRAADELASESGNAELRWKTLPLALERVPPERSATYARDAMAAARLAWTVAGSPSEALRWLQSAWERSPSDARTLFDTMESLGAEHAEPSLDWLSFHREVAGTVGRWEVALRVARDAAERAEVRAERASWLFDAAETLHGKLQRSEEAVPLYREAADLDPQFVAAVERRLQELERGGRGSSEVFEARLELLERQEDWQAAAELLLQGANAAAGDDAARLLIRAASLRFARLLDPEGAFHAWQEALRSAVDSELQGEAADALARVAQDPEHGAEWLERMRPELERRGQLNALLRALLARRAQASSSEERVACTLEAAELLSGRLDRADDAIALLGEEAGRPDAPARVRDQHRVLLREAQRYSEVLSSLDVERTTNLPAERAEQLALERAEVLGRVDADGTETLGAWLDAWVLTSRDSARVELARRLGEPDGPQRALRWVEERERVDSSVEAAEAAWTFAQIAGLETATGLRLGMEAFQRTTLDAERLEALRVAADGANDPSARRAIHEELVARSGDGAARRQSERTLWELALESGDVDEARVRLERYTAEHPDDTEAQEARLELLRPRDAAAWADAVERYLEGSCSVARRLDLLRELAIVHGNELGRPDLAVQALRRLLRQSPEDADAIAVVRAVAEAESNLELLYDTLREGLDAMPDDEARARRHLQLVSLCLEELGDEGRAGEHQWAVAEASTMESNERRDAARWLRERLSGTDAFEDAAHAFAIELETSGEHAQERAERAIDALLETSAWEMAGTLAKVAAASPATTGGLLWDRAALAAARRGDASGVRDALRRWLEEGEPPMPLDRRAQLVAAAVAESDGEMGWVVPLATEVLQEDAEHPDVLAALARDEGETRNAIARQLVTMAENSADARRDLHTAAALLAPYAETAEEAEGLWTRLLDEDRGDEQAFARLDASLRARDAVDARRLLLQRQLEATTDEERRLPLLRALSLLAEDDEERESNLRAIVESDLSDTEARHALAGMYRKQERYPELAEILEDLGEVEARIEDRLRAYHALAKIAQYQLEDRARAAAAMARIVELDPDDVSTLERWTKTLRALESWQDLKPALRLLSERGDSIDTRVECLRELGRLHEKDGEPWKACSALEALVELEPANLPVLEDLARLYAEMERWSDHLHALERLANKTNIRALQAEVFVSAARAMHEHLQRPGEAVDLLANAFETLHPNDAQLDLLRSAAAEAGVWVPLANLLRSVASREEDVERRLLLELEIAQILDERADDGETALGWLMDVFRVNPRPGPVLDAMEALAARRELRSSLIDMYKLLASSNEGDDEIWWRAMASSADVAVDVLERADVAFDIYARVTERPELRERAEERMRALAAEHNLWQKQREWLESQVEDDEDGREARALQKALVEEKELNDWEAAFETLMGALQENPESQAVRTELYRLATEHDAWEIVLKLYEVLLEDVSAAVRVRLLLEMARIQSEVLSQPSNAFTQTMRAWQLRTRDETLRDALRDSAEAAGRRVDLLAAWEWEARQYERLDEQEEALARAAALAVDLDQWERACVAWRSLLSLPGRTAHWMEQSERAAESAERRNAMLDAWRAAVEAIRDPGERELLVLRWAGLAEELDRTADAADLIEEEVENQKRNRALREAQLATLETIEAWPRLSRALEAWANVCDDERRRVELDTRRAELLLHHLDRPEDAVALQRRALRLPGADDRTHQVYVEMLRSLERWDDLVEYHMDRASIADGETRFASYLAAAAVAEEFLGDPRRALRVVDAVLSDAPEHREALEIRARALSGLERWGDQVGTLEQLAGLLEGHAAAQVYGQAADTAELQLFSGRQAVEWWQRASAADPDWLRPHAEVARLELEAGHGDAAITAQRSAVELARTGTRATSRERAEACVRLAELLGGENAKETLLPEVQRLLEEALEFDPGFAPARSAYERVLESSGGLERLLILLDEEMQRASTDVERSRVLCKRGAVFAFEAQRESDARKAIERAATLAPERLAPVALLADIAFSNQRWADAEPLYERLLAADVLDPNDLLEPRKLIVGETPDAQLLSIYRTRHAVCLEKLGRLDDAYDLYTEANLEDPNYPPSLAALARISVLRGNRAGAGIHIQNFFDHAEGAPSEMVGEMKLLAARIAESEGKADEAVRLYDEAQALGGPVRKDVIERAAQAAMRSGSWESVIPRLQQLVDLADTTEERARALVQLVEALTHASDDEPEATRRHLLQAAIFCDERSALLDRATELAEEHLDEESALALFDEMLDSVDTASKKARIHGARARVMQRRAGTVDRAVASEWSAALLCAPEEGSLVERCVAAWRAVGDLDGLIGTLHEAVSKLPDDAEGARVALLRQIGVLAFDDMDDLGASRDAFEALIRVAPSDVPSLEYLLAIYESEGFEDEARATEIAGDLVQRGQLTTDLLRSLERLAFQRENIDGVVQVLQILQFAGEAEPDEEQLLSQLPRSLPALTPNLFADENLARLLRPESYDPDAGRTIAAALAVWARNHTQATQVPGTPVSSGALAELFASLCATLGLEAQLAIDPTQDRATRVVASDPPTVVLSAYAAELDDESVLRHELGRALALAQPDLLAVEALSAFDFVAFLEVAFAPLCADARTLDDSLRRAVVRWEERLSGYVPPVGVAPRTRERWPSASTWKELAMGSALRTGLALGGSASVTLRRAAAELEIAEPRSVSDLKLAAAQHPALGSLLSFLLSHDWLELRKRMGIAHGSASEG